MNVVAHGIGNVQDLPLPFWMLLWSGAVVLVISSCCWQRPLLAAHERGQGLAETVSRFVLGPVRVAAQVLSVALFGLVWAAALFGDTDPYRNLAPTCS